MITAAILAATAVLSASPPEELATFYATVTPRNTVQVVAYRGSSTVPVIVKFSTSTATVTRRHRSGQWGSRRVIIRGAGRVDVRVYSRATGQLLVANAYETVP